MLVRLRALLVVHHEAQGKCSAVWPLHSRAMPTVPYEVTGPYSVAAQGSHAEPLYVRTSIRSWQGFGRLNVQYLGSHSQDTGAGFSAEQLQARAVVDVTLAK